MHPSNIYHPAQKKHKLTGDHALSPMPRVILKANYAGCEPPITSQSKPQYQHALESEILVVFPLLMLLFFTKEFQILEAGQHIKMV